MTLPARSRAPVAACDWSLALIRFGESKRRIERQRGGLPGVDAAVPVLDVRRLSRQRTLSGTQIRQGDQLVISDVVRAECWREVDVRHPGGAVGRPWTRLIHAATPIGAREYSRSNPPSLCSQITGPDVPTASERAIGVRNSSPRWGRASL